MGSHSYRILKGNDRYAWIERGSTYLVVLSDVIVWRILSQKVAEVDVIVRDEQKRLVFVHDDLLCIDVLRF